MNAERTEISRRFVACPKWVWLPGMLDERGRRVVEVRGRKVHFSDGTWCDCDSTTPDLDDDLTRLGGLLAVVRLAWNDSTVAAWHNRHGWFASSEARLRLHEVPYYPTEEAALLAALEAAP